MARYTISGPSPSAVNFLYPFDTFQLTSGHMVQGTATLLALLQLETHLRQGDQSRTEWRGWWGEWQETGSTMPFLKIIFIVAVVVIVIMVDQETTDV